jgi:hypothetical protein
LGAVVFAERPIEVVEKPRFAAERPDVIGMAGGVPGFWAGCAIANPLQPPPDSFAELLQLSGP